MSDEKEFSHVHLYRVLRIKVSGVLGKTHAELVNNAIEIAETSDIVNARFATWQDPALRTLDIHQAAAREAAMASTVTCIEDADGYESFLIDRVDVDGELLDGGALIDADGQTERHQIIAAETYEKAIKALLDVQARPIEERSAAIAQAQSLLDFRVTPLPEAAKPQSGMSL